jgi:hypothetical protein
MPTGSFKVCEIGGPNASGQWWRDDSHEWEWPRGEQNGPANGAGSEVPIYWPWTSQYREEIIPDPVTPTGQVMVVVEIAPAGASAPSPVAYAATETANCAHIASKWAYCTKTGAGTFASSNTFLMSMVGDSRRGKQRRVLLARLPPSTPVALRGGANLGAISNVAGGGKCDAGCKTTAAGTLELDIVVNSNGNGEANTITMTFDSGGQLSR